MKDIDLIFDSIGLAVLLPLDQLALHGAGGGAAVVAQPGGLGQHDAQDRVHRLRQPQEVPHHPPDRAQGDLCVTQIS